MKLGDVELGFYQDWLGRLRDGPAALEKRPTVDHALDFANTGSRRAYAAIIRGVALALGGSVYPASKVYPMSGEQEAFQKALAAIVEKSAALPLLKATWVSLANQLLPVPTYRLVRQVLRVDTRYQQIDVFAPISGRLAQVLMWLIDPAELIEPGKSSDSFGARLCRCHYGKCGRFFFATPPAGGHGLWRKMYCPKPADPKQDHMRMAHNERKRPGRSRSAGSKHK